MTESDLSYLETVCAQRAEELGLSLEPAQGEEACLEGHVGPDEPRSPLEVGDVQAAPLAETGSEARLALSRRLLLGTAEGESRLLDGLQEAPLGGDASAATAVPMTASPGLEPATSCENPDLGPGDPGVGAAFADAMSLLANDGDGIAILLSDLGLDEDKSEGDQDPDRAEGAEPVEAGDALEAGEPLEDVQGEILFDFEEIAQPEVPAELFQDRVSPEVRARQMALDFTAWAGWGREWVPDLVEVFLSSGLSATVRILRQHVDLGLRPELLQPALLLRHVWESNSQYWPEGSVYSLPANVFVALPWGMAFSICDFLGVPVDEEEIADFLEREYVEWGDSPGASERGVEFIQHLRHRLQPGQHWWFPCEAQTMADPQEEGAVTDSTGLSTEMRDWAHAQGVGVPNPGAQWCFAARQLARRQGRRLV